MVCVNRYVTMKSVFIAAPVDLDTSYKLMAGYAMVIYRYYFIASVLCRGLALTIIQALAII